jgi:predicted GIY-YIG superfamily endonuclease
MHRDKFLCDLCVISAYLAVKRLSSQRRVLYIGITSPIETRVRQHKSQTFSGFTPNAA